MNDTRDPEARAAIVELTHTIEQMIQLSSNHLFLVSLKPQLERMRHRLVPPQRPIIHVAALPSATPGAVQEHGTPPPTDNGQPFLGCRACGRAVDQLIAEGHSPECDAIRNPTVIQVG